MFRRISHICNAGCCLLTAAFVPPNCSETASSQKTELAAQRETMVREQIAEAVAMHDAGAFVAEALKVLPRHLGEGLDNFDRVDLGACVREDSGLVAGTGADFQNFIPGSRTYGFGHECHDVRLRDGLAVTDRQRVVGVGLAAQTQREKFVPRHGAHGMERGGIGDALCEVPGTYGEAGQSRAGIVR